VEVDQAQADPPALDPVQTAPIVYFQPLLRLVAEVEVDILAALAPMAPTQMVHWVEQVAEPRSAAVLVLVLLAKVMPAVQAGLPVQQVARAVDSQVAVVELMAPVEPTLVAPVAPVAHLLYQGQA